MVKLELSAVTQFNILNCFKKIGINSLLSCTKHKLARLYPYVILMNESYANQIEFINYEDQKECCILIQDYCSK